VCIAWNPALPDELVAMRILSGPSVRPDKDVTRRHDSMKEREIAR